MIGEFCFAVPHYQGVMLFFALMHLESDTVVDASSLAGSEAASPLPLTVFFLAVSQALSKSIRADCKKASLPVILLKGRFLLSVSLYF